MNVIKIIIVLTGTRLMMARLPKICQTQTEPQIYQIEALQTCNNLKVDKVNIQLEVTNVKIYKTEAKGILIKEHICDTFTNFFNEKEQYENTNIVDITEENAKEMIDEQKCLSANGKYRYGEFKKSYECRYSYLKWRKTITNTCFFYSGFVIATHSGKVSSSISDTSGCNYNDGYCKAGNTHIKWTPDEKINKKYINMQETECMKVDSHIICDKLSKSFNLERFVYNSTEESYENDMWRIKIKNVVKDAGLNLQVNLTAESDLGKQIEALKAEIQSKFQYIVDWYSSPKSRMNIMCLSILQINKITRASMKLYATEFAEILSNSQNVVAKATENYIAIWPCKTINTTEFEFTKLKDCYNHIPIKYLNKTGFIDESLIFHQTATMISCIKAPTKLFELENKLYKQRQNHIPVEIGTEDASSMNYFINFNFTKMEDLSDEWQIEPEYFDTTASLFENIKEEMSETREAQANMEKNSDTQVKLDIFGIKSLTSFGIIECIMTWISKIGGWIAIIACIKKRQCGICRSPQQNGGVSMV